MKSTDGIGQKLGPVIRFVEVPGDADMLVCVGESFEHQDTLQSLMMIASIER